MSLSVTPPDLYATPPIEFYRLPSSFLPVSPTPQPDSGSGSGGSVSVSPQGQFLNNLQNLQSTQPQKLQAALTQAATGLTAAAQQAGLSTPQGEFLANSAVQLQQVASGGSVSALQPPAPANVVEQTYRPNEVGGGQGALALFSAPQQTPTLAATPAATAHTSSTVSATAANSTGASGRSAKTLALSIPDLFGPNSATASNGSTALQSVSEILKQLQQDLSA